VYAAYKHIFIIIFQTLHLRYPEGVDTVPVLAVNNHPSTIDHSQPFLHSNGSICCTETLSTTGEQPALVSEVKAAVQNICIQAFSNNFGEPPHGPQEQNIMPATGDLHTTPEQV